MSRFIPDRINAGRFALRAVFLLGALVTAAAASAATCMVTEDGAGNNDGATWANAMTLQTALASGSGCSEVWVKAGTYTPTSGTDRTISFNIQPGVKVYGGFAGTESQRSERDPGANLTTLSGDIGTGGDNSDNSYHVVWMDGTTAAGIITASTVLNGFTIGGGNADDFSSPHAAGGGLYCRAYDSGNECSPSLSNVTFSGNSARYYGGAIYSYGGGSGNSSPTLSNVTFSGNSVASYGGAMYNNGDNGTSSPTLSNVTFSGNSAGDSGGAMYNDGGTFGTSSPTLSNVTFSGNSADGHGGAMYNDGYTGGTSSPSLSNVIAWSNTAPDGPEIHNLSATPAIDHSVIQGSGGSSSWDGSLGTDGGGNLDADPELGVLADNGGLTWTMLPGAGSSAIDAGNAMTCSNAPVSGFDQRGVARPQGAHCDIGAVEVEVEQYALNVTVTGSGHVSAGANPAPFSGGISNCTATGGANCAAIYPAHADATLSAVADAGQHLVAWGGDCASDGSVTMDADKTCSASFAINTYTVGGIVSGLSGSGLVLQINGGDDLAIAVGGSFTFATPLDDGTNYSVTVRTQPGGPTQICSVDNGTGTVSGSDVDDVAVNCTNAGDIIFHDRFEPGDFEG